MKMQYSIFSSDACSVFDEYEKNGDFDEFELEDDNAKWQAVYNDLQLTYDSIIREIESLTSETFDIIVLADLGLWNGRCKGYKIIRNVPLSEIFQDTGCDYGEWYADRYNIKYTGYHHDGTNHYTFRILKDKTDRYGNYTVENLMLQQNYKLDSRQISYYTESLKPIFDKLFKQ